MAARLASCRRSWGGSGWLAAAGLLLQLFCRAVVAQEASADSPRGMQIITSGTRETFAAIRSYLRQTPNAPDRAAAEAWIFATARDLGLEGEVIDLAQAAAERDGAELAERQAAQAVQCLGLATTGSPAAALEVFERYLRGLRLRNPNEATDLAMSLALRLQLAGEPVAAVSVYDRLSGAFFLNAEVRDFCTARKSRLELLGKPAPAIDAPDLSGAAVRWEDARGKIVVLDFWATNCRPCVEALPRLRALYRELQPQGCEFLGVSLDEDAAAIDAFRASNPIPWRIVLDAKQVAPAYQVALIPCLIIVDKDGKVAATDARPHDLRYAISTLRQPAR